MQHELFYFCEYDIIFVAEKITFYYVTSVLLYKNQSSSQNFLTCT